MNAPSLRSRQRSAWLLLQNVTFTAQDGWYAEDEDDGVDVEFFPPSSATAELGLRLRVGYPAANRRASLALPSPGMLWCIQLAVRTPDRSWTSHGLTDAHGTAVFAQVPPEAVVTVKAVDYPYYKESEE